MVLKITAVQTRALSRVVRPEYAIISAAGSQPESHFVIIEIKSDQGISGFGEASVVPVWSGENQAGALNAIDNLLAAVLIGQDPRNINALADAMDRVLFGNSFTKAGVEMALLDLLGKALDVPAYVLVGGRRRQAAIPLKFSIGAFPPVRAGEVAKSAVALGFGAVKVKVGLDIRTDIERVEAVRSATGPSFPVAVDANGGWTESQTRIAIPDLERLGVVALEQPLRRGDFRGCARLRQRTPIPLMLDESVFTRQDALEAIREDAFDLISIYPGKNGGVLRSLEIAQMAATAGKECIIGSNLEMELGSAAMLTLAVAAPALSTTVHHDIIGPVYYSDHANSPAFKFEAGCAVLSEAPGLGVPWGEETR